MLALRAVLSQKTWRVVSVIYRGVNHQTWAAFVEVASTVVTKDALKLWVVHPSRCCTVSTIEFLNTWWYFLLLIFTLCAVIRQFFALQDHCVPVCEENVMGLIFYRLILTNGVIISLQEVAMAYFMCRCFKKPLEMDGTKFFVKIIETQACGTTNNYS